MALQTLKETNYLRQEQIIHMDSLREMYPERFTETGAMDAKWFEETIRPYKFIYVRHDKNSISFTLQNGPVKEVGKNGCQVDHLILAAAEIISGFQKTHPCKENAMVITKLEEAVLWLEKRTKQREHRGVEGTSNL